MADHILTLSCDDRPGIVAGITTALAASGANIVEAQQFEDRGRRRFFMRVRFETDADAGATGSAIAFALRTFGATHTLHRADERLRILILTSRSDHCLADLLYRWRTGELAIEPVGIVSNWPLDPSRGVDVGDIPFHHLPVDGDNRAEQEERILRIADESGAQLVVLARCMQILSDGMASRLQGRCVNIHHSFLPGFKGARPYHQAHARGVKLIGATAHFVTPDLDEGPIIEQDVERVSHRDIPSDLIRRGRDIERRVLARAVRLIAEHRVILNDDTTVVFD